VTSELHTEIFYETINLKALTNIFSVINPIEMRRNSLSKHMVLYAWGIFTRNQIRIIIIILINAVKY
jgi:hypothetical protein